MTKPTRVSYVFIVVTLVVVAWLHLATPLITILFGYFALSKLSFGGRKWIASCLFIILVFAIFYGFVFFLKAAFATLPDIASTSIPLIIQYARQHGLEMPFTDLDGLKVMALETVKDELRSLGNFAKFATKEFVFLVIGLVVAVSLFLNPTLESESDKHVLRNSLYTQWCDAISARFRSFYQSFATVMGAQLIISLINTTLTAIFITSVSLPYAGVVVVVTFLCGLLPIIGNLISNSVIVGIAFTISPKLGLIALVFLVVLHKLEYILNSKIIGKRIKNPMWLTLLALLLGERLMGIPGMILAPVILNYIKVEASNIEVNDQASDASAKTAGTVRLSDPDRDK